MRGFRSRSMGVLLLVATLTGAPLFAEPVPVLYLEGSHRAFLVLNTKDGKRIASGDLTQGVQGTHVTCRLVFHFIDGSVDDETTVFTQQKTFRLISDHHIQRGPSFPHPIDVTIHAATGQITTRTEKGEVREDHLDLPSDLSNGLLQMLIMNLPPSAPVAKFSYVAPTSKPRLVKLSVKPAGTVKFRIGDIKRQATDYVIHFEIGGMAGAIAPMLGKQPSDVHVWIAGGTAPAFIREEGQLYEGGPILRIEQISPTFDH